MKKIIKCFALRSCKLIIRELRQLRRSEHRVIAHQQRWIDFGVAVLPGVQIEHELPDGALQPREALLQNDEARAGHFGSRLEVHELQTFAKLHMLLRLERIIALRAEVMMLDIAVLVGAVRHLIERQVRNLREFFLQFLFDLLHRRFKLGKLCLEFANLGHQRICARIVLVLLGVADFLGGRVAARLRLLRCQDGRAALLVERDQRLRQRLQPAPFQRCVEGVGVVANGLDVMHLKNPVMAGLVPAIYVFG